MAKINDDCKVYGLYSDNDPSNIRYIGQTSGDICDRICRHRSNAKSERESIKRLPVYKWMKSVHNRGYNVEYVILKDNAIYNVDEIRIIKEYRDNGNNLMNVTDGGLGSKNRIQTQETRRKISLIHKGKKWDNDRVARRKEWLKDNHPWNGRKHSEESKIKMSESSIGTPSIYKGTTNRFTDEQKKQIGKSRSEYSKKYGHSATGTRHTDETKEKLRQINLGKTTSEETKAKMSTSQKVRVQSDEYINPMSGVKRSKEFKAKMSENMKKRTINGGYVPTFKGRKHTEETKAKMREIQRMRGLSNG